MDNRKDKFHIICKATCGCNLNCEYCYDHKNRATLGNKIASYEVIDKMANLTAKYTKRMDWLWHGGEPTTIPFEWYENVQDIFAKYYNCDFAQSLQSNGVNFLKDRTLVSKFKELDINPGVSFDILNQQARLGKNSEQIMEDYCDLMKEIHYDGEGQNIAALTVVTIKNICNLVDMYEFMKSKFVGYRFNLALLYVTQHQYEVKDLEIPLDTLICELTKFYNYIFSDTDSNASYDLDMIRLITLLIYQHRIGSCHYADCRKSRIGLHPDGEVLYCDSEFPKFKLGNIMDYDDINDIFETENFKLLSKQIDERYAHECTKCSFYRACKGDCHHLHMDSEGNVNKCNKHACNELKARLKLLYNKLQSIDVDSSINPALLEVFETSVSLLPKEVEYYLNQEGYSVSLTLDVEDEDFLISPQYEIINLFTSREIDTRKYLFSEQRKESFNKIFDLNKDKIIEYINEIKVTT